MYAHVLSRVLQHIVEYLRRLADTGRTVLFTIHQPNSGSSSCQRKREVERGGERWREERRKRWTQPPTRTYTRIRTHNTTYNRCMLRSNSEIYAQFSKLMILARGRTVYSGGAEEAVPYFSGLGYELPAFTNPADFFLHVRQHSSWVAFLRKGRGKEGETPKPHRHT